MRIAIVVPAPDWKDATGVRGRSLKAFLDGEGHQAEFVHPPLRGYHRQLTLWRRIRRRLPGARPLLHLWDDLADQLEPAIRRNGYDVVISVGTVLGLVLTRVTGCMRILDMHNISFLELYYNFGSKMDEVEQTYERELVIWRKVDAILVPHALLAGYFLSHIGPQIQGVAERTHIVRLGCEPSTRLANFSPRPRGVYAGSYYPIQDPYLLAYLSKISPYPIDCYGPNDPNRIFFPSPLRYRGFVPTKDFLADYQFGVITVSRDALRQHSPSTKFADYFAHGLPVVFPEWMKEGYEYPGCALPYNEGNFPEVASRLADEPTWARMSRAARASAAELSTPIVLRPLADLIKHLEPARSVVPLGIATA